MIDVDPASRAGDSLARVSVKALCGKSKASRYVGKAFTLVYEANLPEDHESYWLAEMFINDFNGERAVVSLKDDSPILIMVCDSARNPIKSGELRMCGAAFPISDGKTFCTLSQLKDFILKPDIVLASNGHGLVHGRLKIY